MPTTHERAFSKGYNPLKPYPKSEKPAHPEPVLKRFRVTLAKVVTTTIEVEASSDHEAKGLARLYLHDGKGRTAVWLEPDCATHGEVVVVNEAK